MLPTTAASDSPPPSLFDRRHAPRGSFSSDISVFSTAPGGKSARGGRYYRRIVPPVLKRIVRFRQMDFEFALWEMFYLCTAPRRVYRNIYYHKQTKNQWSRDDPAFMVILSFLLCCGCSTLEGTNLRRDCTNSRPKRLIGGFLQSAGSSVAYGLAYGHGMVGIFRMMLYMVFVDFVFAGFLVATVLWAFANRFLTHHSVHAVEQSVEWAYAFDVHCNSFFPLFLITYVLQFFLMPVLAGPTAGWFSTVLGNTMYAVAAAYYVYITFLGYNALPFLIHTKMFLYPIAIIAILYVVSLFSFNISANLLALYFQS